jgi:GTP:adenosylcobinamide-phosphate guanylyltransferase
VTNTVTALVLAGNRPGPDPLRDSTGASHKALIRIDDRPLLDFVLEAMGIHPAIGRVIVAAQGNDMLRSDAVLQRWTGRAQWNWIEAQPSIAETLETVLADPEAQRPLLVTTADNVLLTPNIMEEFLNASNGADLAVGMVERTEFSKRFPNNRRTWLKFRDGQWSGANLFLIGSGDIQPLLDIWRTVEQDRKKGWRLIGAFGPWLLARAVVGQIALKRAIADIGRRHGLDARLVGLSHPEACIDVDKPEDLELASALLAERQPIEN